MLNMLINKIVMILILLSVGFVVSLIFYIIKIFVEGCLYEMYY